MAADRFTIAGRLRSVEFVDLTRSTASDVDGSDNLRVGVRRMDHSTFWLRIGNQEHRIAFAQTEGGMWIWHQGRARLVENGNGEPRRTRRTAKLPGVVTPPMPATVVRILVSVGDEVEQGQALVVVSAMKMETTLTAPHKGSVRAIRAEVGATVRPGEVVVDVEEKA